MTPVRALFVMEVGLGHTTFLANFKRYFASVDCGIEARFVEVEFENPGGIWKLPKLRNELQLMAGLAARKLTNDAVAEFRPEVIHFHTQTIAIFCTKLMREIPSVVSIDATRRQFKDAGAPYGLQKDGRSPLSRLAVRQDRLVFQRARRIVPFADWAALGAIHDYDIDPRKLVVIPPGIDLRFFSPGPSFRREELRLLFVGGDFWRKGGDLMVRWMNECAPEGVTLDIVTRDPVPQTRNTRIHRDIGPNDPRLPELYRAADLFVLPTRGDLAPVAIEEALACGLPVLATSVGAISEMLAEGDRRSQCGFLVPPDDWEAFKTELSRLVSHREVLSALRTNARAQAETRFDLTKNMDRETELLKALASKNAS